MSELKEIMKRRRRIVETADAGDHSNSNNEGSITDLQELQHHGGSPHNDCSQHMSSDLQAKLERRRRMADSVGSGLQVDTAAEPMTSPYNNNHNSGSSASVVASPVKAELKPVAMVSDLQAIMARRRRLAGGDDVAAAPDADAHRPVARDRMPLPIVSGDDADPPGKDQHNSGGSWKATGHSRQMQEDTSTNHSEGGDAVSLHYEHARARPLAGSAGTIDEGEASPTQRPTRPKKKIKDSENDNSDSSRGPPLSPTKQPRRTKDSSVDASTTDGGRNLSPTKSSRRPRVHQQDSGIMSMSSSADSSGPKLPRRKPSARGTDLPPTNDDDPSSPQKDSVPRVSQGKQRSKQRAGGSRSGSDESGSSSGDPARRRGTRRQKSMCDDSEESGGKRGQTPRNKSGALMSPPGASSGEDEAVVRKPIRKARSSSKDSDASGEMNPLKSSRKSRKPELSSHLDTSPVGDKRSSAASQFSVASSKQSERSTTEPLKSESTASPAVAGWGDSPAFAGFPSGGDAFGGGFPLDTVDGVAAAFGGGGAFDDAFTKFASDTDGGFGNFDQTSFPPVSRGTSDPKRTESFTKPDFDSAFSPAGFGSDMEFDAFGSPGLFPKQAAAKVAPPKKVWDKSPLSGELPKRAVRHLGLRQKPVFSCTFERSPISNPLNTNIIFCSSRDGVFYLHEVESHRGGVQVCCAPVLSSELKRKIAAKYNASVHSVYSVHSIAAGLHQANGQARVRVAAILDLDVLESKQILRIIAVWQWGYGSPNPVSLQYIILPPSGADFTFDPSSLQTADGLLFLAGGSPKGPCMFMCKPAGKETWSANILGGSGHVTCMSVTPGLRRLHPYLAIALDNGPLTIWTYSSALGTSAAKDSGASKRWLFPLCRLEHASVFASVEASCPNEEGTVVGKDRKEVGYCTQLEWLPPRSSFHSMLMIAAAFQNGLAVFHVGLPVVKDQSKHGFKPLPVPTQGTGLSQTPLLLPFSACRWQGRSDESCVSWLDFGPQNALCLALALRDGDSMKGGVRMVFGTLDLPLYRKAPLSNDGLIPFRVCASTTVAKDSELLPLRLLRGAGTLNLISASEKFLMQVTLFDNAIKKSDGFGVALSLPVASQPSGLTSSGEPLLVDTVSDKDGILHVYNVLQCERKKSKADASLLDWSPPSMRHWLIRTVAGDTKQTAASDEKEDRGFGGDDEVAGGAVSDVVCDLYHEDLVGQVPFRIIRCLNSTLCAIAYRTVSSLDKASAIDVSLDSTVIAFVDCAAGNQTSVVEVIRARDVAFLPCTSDRKEPCGVLLSEDGSTLTFFSWETSAKSCKLGSAFRPLVGVELNDDFVDCRRFFAFSGAGKVVFAAVGTRPRDGCSCFVIGDLSDAETMSEENWSDRLPNIVEDRVCWFEEEEEILSVIGLEGDDSGYRNFAASTTSRVLILSSALKISAEVKSAEACSSLSPVGPFAVSYCCKNKLEYLCCLDRDLSSGLICNLPLRKHGFTQNQLLGLRPDRVLLIENHSGTRNVEYGQPSNSFLLPTATTWPALLLEPLVANAVCVGGKQSQSVPVLRTVVERFGRSVASITHGDDEGIGHLGAGLTPRVFDILRKYGLRQASSWLLTGSVSFDRGANSTILPPWLPAASKAVGGLNSDAFLHVVSNGDQYFSDYIKSPDQNIVSTLPRQSDPAVYLCREYAHEALQQGRSSDALKLLDFAGCDATETLAVQLALLLEKDSSRDASCILKLISGYNVDSRLPPKAPSSFAAVATFLKESSKREDQMSDDQIKRWIRPLAPSLQRGTRGGRTKQRITGEKDLAAAAGQEIDTPDPLWVSPCIEAKHVWNEGPRRKKENLLMLDRIEDWIGRRRPLILGKEGVAAAGDRGEKTLADLLNQDDDSFGEKSDLESEKDEWVEGVGEGRSDEANLSAYFRMSEGEDEDSPWSSDGLQDLSPYQNKAVIVGDAGSFSLQPSTSGVDEGEPGKVKILYDLVFEKSGHGTASGLALPATRGNSVDLGVLLGQDRHSRRRCTMEFWYFLPSSDSVTDEIVLARRTMGEAADDFSKVCIASDKENVLWELCLLKSGEVEFRSCGGSVLSSSQNYNADVVGGDKTRQDLAMFEKWNHVCVVLSSKNLSVTECSVSLFMKGNEVASAQMSMLPSGYEEDDLDSPDTLKEIVNKSQILFGLNHSAGFRLTELRIWACERSADDTQSFLYEYLTAAEAKKKFKVKISQKNKGSGGLAGPPKGGFTPQRGFLATTKSGFLPASARVGGLTPPPGGSDPNSMSLAPPPKDKFSLAPEAPKDNAPAASAASFDSSFGTSFGQQANKSAKPKSFPALDQSTIPEEGEYDEGEVPATLWDTALPLSRQVRSSAAAALIRGPPATRHFGGNRGGLPDFIGMERFGVGGIAICGSEKTIVWRDNEDPPALTYPIGASGAVVSDQMDDAGSEFLCCFLAKEKRMVVFELQSRSVVVELQMTTKLNFWRYLPPEAAENTLCFILVTPVGGFHWMPLEESPRPHQVWKRGPGLQGKKVVNYEEGGSNGLENTEIRSRVGLVTVTKAAGNGSLEVWIIPIAGDSRAVQLSANVMGSCLCQPPSVENGAFLPLVVTVHQMAAGIFVNILSLTEPAEGSLKLGEVERSQMIDMEEYGNVNYEPPALAMGTFPEAICCSLSNIFVVILRRRGVIAAFELEDGDLSLIAQEAVGHYIVDAVMRYSAEVGGAEIVMLLSDNDNPKDGRIVSFCFRSAA